MSVEMRIGIGILENNTQYPKINSKYHMTQKSQSK